MSPRNRRSFRFLTLVAVTAAALVLPALASASYSIKWGKAGVLVNPKLGHQLTSATCVPTVTSTAVSSATASTTGAAGAGPTVTNAGNLCAVGDSLGDIFVSVHPARGATSWLRERVDTAAGGIPITGIACPSLNLCVAVDANGQVTHSVNPYGGAKYWTKMKRIDPTAQAGGGFAGLAGIACPSTHLCLAVDNGSDEDQLAYTTDPAGPASDWKLVTLGQSIHLDAVACANVNLCVLGGNERLYSTDPTGAATAWTAIGTLAGTSSNIASLSCASPKLCVGVGYGDAGSGLSAGTSTLASAGGTWVEAYVGADPPDPSAGLVDSVSCPQTNFCVAADGASNYYTTATPVKGDWAGPTALKPNSTAVDSALACNTTVCVEVDDRGTVVYGSVKGAPVKSTSTTTKTTTTGTTKTTTKSTSTTTK